MTVYDLRDRAPGHGQVSMSSEDRIALSVAADRERVRILRKPWWESMWLRAGIVIAGCGAVFNLIAVFHR